MLAAGVSSGIDGGGSAAPMVSAPEPAATAEHDIFKAARARRAQALQKYGYQPHAVLTSAQTQEVWSEWQTDWAAEQFEILRNARSSFGGYIHKAIGPHGEKLYAW